MQARTHAHTHTRSKTYSHHNIDDYNQELGMVICIMHTTTFLDYGAYDDILSLRLHESDWTK